MLTDLLFDDVDRKHLGPVREKLPGEGKMKVLAEGKMSGAVRTLCGGFVAVAWKAMVGATNAMRPKVEEGLGAALGPVKAAKGDVVGKTSESTSSVIAPVKDKVLVPLAGAIAKPVFAVASALFKGAVPVFEEQAGELTEAAAEKGDVLGAEQPSSMATKDKLAQVRLLCEKHSVDLRQVCFMGDDLPDLGALAAVGLAVAPSNAHPWILPRTHWQTRAAGGSGAARELCDLILDAQGHVDALLEEWTR